MSRAEGEGRQVPGVDPTDAQAVQPKAGGLDVSWTRADAGGPPELLTVPEAARWLGLGRSTLYAALAAKRVPVSPIDIGGRVRLSRRQLERWLDGQNVGEPDSPAPTMVPTAPPTISSVYDEVFRDLAPAAGESRSPTRSADTRSSSARACA